MVISAKGLSDGVIKEQDFKGFYGEFRDRISATLLSGFKKQVRQKVLEKMPTSATVKQVNSAVKEEAERLSQIQLSSLDNFLLGDGVE
jgi:argonaute-like protein implicated in RNA metabolism and viral defense